MKKLAILLTLFWLLPNPTLFGQFQTEAWIAGGHNQAR
jgi:hypothetical protein